ncbi:MAG: LysM peptidoglycan-binding domain-containing protein, partial [Actinomycetota bacterium]
EVHVVSRGETLSGIAARYGTSVSVLASANGLGNPDALVVGQALRIPARVFMNSIHVVRSGETLSDIAARYGTSPATLARVNHVQDPDLVLQGTRLRVPGGGSLSTGGAPTGSVATAGSHVVSRGETLSSIAVRYGVSVKRLAAANGIGDPNRIVAGANLKIPGGSTASAAPASATHVVSRGETLSSIAARYGTSATALARINDLRNANLIVAGTRLDVPGGAPATASPTAAPPAVSIEQVAASLENQALAHGVDLDLVKAVAWQESGWQQDVVSSAGAIGVMQVMPGTARFVNRVLGGGSLDVREADDNVHLGVMYLHHLLSTMATERDALAAYLAGPGNVGRKLTREQRRYVDAVQAHKSDL